MNNRQAQLEEAIGMMSQEIGTTKELLEMLFVPQAPMTTKGDNVVEERRAEQQAAKTTMRGKAASGHHTKLAPSHELNLPSQPYRIARRQTLRLDHPNLTMEQCQASHRGPWHQQDHRRKSELEEDQSQCAMCSTDSARTLRKTCTFT